MRRIIGICGPIGSGKSSLAEALLGDGDERRGEIVSMATPLKQAAYGLGWDGKKDAKGRRLLQVLGTDLGRECIGESIWLWEWLQAVTSQTEQDELVVVDDVRFENEAKLIRLLGGVIVQLHGRDLGTVGQNEHTSERRMPHSLVTYSVDSSGTLPEMIENALRALGGYGE
jgi:hypothetical protein